MIKLELSEQTIQVIGAGLQELPFKIAAPVLQELQKQVSEQQQKEVKNEDDSS